MTTHADRTVVSDQRIVADLHWPQIDWPRRRPSRRSETGCLEQRRDQDGSRVHCDSLDEGGARRGLCGITTATPQYFTVVSRSVVKANPGVPNNTLNMVGRTALGPYPPGSSRSSLERRIRRFLAYSFPSRSPGPHHLAVLTRSDFVGAACCPHRHHPARAAPSFTVLLRQDRQKRSHTPLEYTAPHGVLNGG
jgi:hypothetical protein